MRKPIQLAARLIQNREPGAAGPLFAWVVRPLFTLVMLSAVLLLSAGSARAADRTPFDHLTTGFELLGQHRDLPCESCHVNAIFKGTPRDCASCHGVGTQVRATAKPASHILTSNLCESCHTPVAWSPAVNFDHREVQGSCSSCHNNVQAQGMGPNHIVTDLQCDICHTTIGWAGAVFSHKDTVKGCAACHNGLGATGPPANHVPLGAVNSDNVSAQCENCHTPTNYTAWSMTNMTALAPPGMVHALALPSAVCSTCHEAGVSTPGSPPTVLRPKYMVPSNAASGPHPTTGECSNCHLNTNSFLGATGLPAGHIPLPAADGINCGLCHATSDYTVAVMNHVNIANNCAQCHAAGLSFTGIWTTPLKAPPANHIPVGAAGCEGCHDPGAFTSFKIPNVSSTSPPGMVHTAVPTALCATCHAAGVGSTFVMPVKEIPAITSAGGHVQTGTGDCGTCHSNTSFTTFSMTNATATAPPGMVHTAVSAVVCSTCHEAGLSFLGAPATVLRPQYLVPNNPASGLHVMTGECSNCHTNTVSFLNASNLPNGHIPLPAADNNNCALCHATTDYTVAVMNHANIGGNCAQCHAAGLTFLGVWTTPLKAPPSNHVQIGTAACEACHSKSVFTSFQMPNATQTSPPGMVHAVVSSLACSSCHEAGLSFVGVPPTVLRPQYLVPGNSSSGLHPSGECSNCHLNTTSFAGASLYPTNHIPNPGGSGATCTNCHATSDYSQYAMSHNGINNNCAQCHAAGLSFAGVWTAKPLVAPPTNHIPTGATACESCHAASTFTNFKIANTDNGSPPGMVHAALGTLTCTTCHAAGVGSAFVMPVKEIPTIGSPGGHVQTGGADCKSCHTPTAFTSFVFANKTGTAPPAMVHSLVSSVVCSTCHEAGLSFLGAPATVLRPQYLVPGNSSSGLHPSGECSNCHLNTTSFAGASLYPTNHIPNPGGSGATCTNCHATSDYSQYAMSHNGINNNCAQCHAAGLSFAGVWTAKPLVAPPANHIPFGSTKCESCHSASAFTNFKINNADTGAPPGMVHTALGAVSCLTCHAAGVGSKFVMPVKEIPTIGSPGGHVQTGGADCGSCHTPTTFTSFVFANKTGTAPPAMVHSLVSGVVCSTCHEAGLTFVGAPVTVVRPQYLVPGNSGSGLHPTTGECSNCHLNTTSFAGATLYPNNHIPNPGGATANCTTCHTTGDYAAYVMSHNGINNNCAQCHAAGLSFAGVWTTTPLKAPPTNHIPFGAVACESCHANNVFTNFKVNNADSGAPPGMVHSALGAVSCLTCHAAGVGSKFVMPVKEIPTIGSPGGHVQTGGADCGSCHTPTAYTSFVFANKTGTAPPSMVHSLVSSVVCSTCHEAALTFVGAPATVVRPQYLVPGNSGSGLHPATGECSNCHFNTTSFLGAISYPSGHIPNPGGAAGTCANCHTNAADYSVYTMNHTGITNNCAQCHAAGLSFAGVWTAKPLVAPPGTHIPFGATKCESCHLATTFTNFKVPNADSGAAPGMVHSALGTVSCSTCHAAGVGSKFVMPVKEIPTIGSPGGHVQINGADCKSCHAPAGYTTFVFTNATGTAPPSMVHSLVSSIVCSTCHEAGLTFVGAPATVVRPQYKVPGNSGSGLHATTGECSNCHLNTTSFLGATDYPTGHIPNPGGSSGTCANCHTTGNYSVYVMNHTGITNNCAACHATGLTFAGVWTGSNKALVAPPTNHVPFKNSGGTTADCSVCHSNAAFTTFAFTNASGTAPSAMVHTAVSGIACATCHAAGLSFVGTPATKAPPGNHVPFGTAACEGCHSGSTFTSFAFTNKTGTAPPAMVHSLVSSTACSTCHEAGRTFVGTPVTVVRPQYKVPGSASSGLHATTGECSNCHLNTTSFLGAVDYPSGHIPNPGGASATCTNCHTTGDYAVYIMSHAGITSGCAACHAYGLSFYGVWTAPNKALVAPPAGATGHIPSNAPNGTGTFACEACHSASAFTTFSGTVMKHAVVTSMTCMSCHELGMTWKTNTGVRLWVRDSANHYKGQDCGGSGCHTARDKTAVRRSAAARGQVAAVARTTTALGGTSALTGTLAGTAGMFDHRRVGASPCVSCHGPASGSGKPAGHILTSDSCQNCHSTAVWLPVTAVDHTQVQGSCVSCHNGVVASGKSKTTHIASSDTCATCHTTNAWTPARFEHTGVAAHSCRSCHDSIHATGLPANHVVTAAQCDACHGTLSWTPATLDHTTLTNNCVSCHNNRIALGVSPTHMNSAIDCAVCHSYPDWTVLRFAHTAATYPGAHKAAPACVACHTSNTDQIPWPAPAEAGSCAGCHAADFTAGHHPRTTGALQYTVSELRDCTGACHVYSDATQGTLVKAVPGPYHRVSDVAFKH